MSKIGIPMLAGTVPEDHMLSQAFRSQYWRKVRAIRPGSLYAYWPIWEPSGTDVQDYSGQGDRATSTGLGGGAWGGPVRNPGPDGVHQAPEFQAGPSHVNILSAEFSTHFNGLEGTLLCWAKAASAGQWVDTLDHAYVRLYVDANNYIVFWQGSAANTLIFDGKFGGIGSYLAVPVASPGVNWFSVGLTWSRIANQYMAYFQGVKVGATLAIGAAWAGVPTVALLGAYTTGAAYPWLGYLAHAAFWNVPLNASEIRSFAEV
jgi:hypothetical protein